MVNMTKKKGLVSFIFCALCVFLIPFFTVACADTSVKDGIEISNAFKTEYEIGEAIDVSGGVLKCVIDGKESFVPITVEMVSGFDSSTAGDDKQLVITYNDMTTTLNYKVYPEFLTLNQYYFAYEYEMYNYIKFMSNATFEIFQSLNEINPDEESPTAIFTNATREIKNNKWVITAYWDYGESELPEQYTESIKVVVNSKDSLTVTFISNTGVEAATFNFSPMQ